MTQQVGRQLLHRDRHVPGEEGVIDVDPEGTADGEDPGAGFPKELPDEPRLFMEIGLGIGPVEIRIVAPAMRSASV